jgi:hypothetical protein
MIKRVLGTFGLAFAVTLLAAASAGAQALPPPPEAGVFFQKNFDIKIEGTGAGTFGFMAAPISFENETVTGAPYSAEAVTDVVQSLADGNRIARQSKAQLARDSAGRTRREQGLSMLGPMVNDPSDFRQVQITDPAARTIILLDMNRQTAHRMPAPTIRVTTQGTREVTVLTGPPESAGEPMTDTFEMALPAPPAGAFGGVKMFRTGGPKDGMPAPVVESLGKQIMEGVEADGTRTTFTIPADQIGNDLPIHIVSERWFSPELKVLVMSRQSDPRFGETTYRLTNIIRGEPSSALFEVPPDFTVQEGGSHDDVIFRKMTK